MNTSGTTAAAMSGGVDSSVAAAMLAREGRRLVGFSMQLIDKLAGEAERYGRCCSPEDFKDARRVAERMGFPHYIIDMEQEFMDRVVLPFARDYAAGRTPSPCVNCNTFIKFDSLIARSRAVGAEKVATGHYAILERDPKTGRTLLRKARDLTKDQSYFLFDLSDEQRAAAEFPLGRLSKDEVRELAREFRLDNADKPESMDLCFVAKGEDYRGFLERQGLMAQREAGEIVNSSGEVLGEHGSIGDYTVGQRKGIQVPSQDKLYVLRIEPEQKRVVVGGGDELLNDRCVIERTRWIPFEILDGPISGSMRIRSNDTGSPATVTPLPDGRAEVRFDVPQRAIAPGQAAVLYDGDLVLGGGWIVAGSATK
ncbi:hypothetical protein ABI59_04500 [Acidobacteria bacterium Mor1]|nr:hypothetical protein ABI59_04500 [Acidobacteria bacterium Mor1]